MPAGPFTIRVRVRLKWWVPAYLNVLAFVAWAAGATPDGEKVGSFLVRRGLVIAYE